MRGFREVSLYLALSRNLFYSVSVIEDCAKNQEQFVHAPSTRNGRTSE